MTATTLASNVFFRVLAERVEPHSAVAPDLPPAGPRAWRRSRLDHKTPRWPSASGLRRRHGAVERLHRARCARAAPAPRARSAKRAKLGRSVSARRALPRRSRRAIPPAGGNALGVDRLVMLVLGATHIDDVVAIRRRGCSALAAGTSPPYRTMISVGIIVAGNGQPLPPNVRARACPRRAVMAGPRDTRRGHFGHDRRRWRA